MKKFKPAKLPLEFYSWLNIRKLNIEKMVGKKVSYADTMRIIGMTRNIWIDDGIISNFFSKKRRKIPNVFI